MFQVGSTLTLIGLLLHWYFSAEITVVIFGISFASPSFLKEWCRARPTWHEYVTILVENYHPETIPPSYNHHENKWAVQTNVKALKSEEGSSPTQIPGISVILEAPTGITFSGNKSTGLFVKKVARFKSAALSGMISPGMVLTSIDAASIEGKTWEEASAMITTWKKKGEMGRFHFRPSLLIPLSKPWGVILSSNMGVIEISSLLAGGSAQKSGAIFERMKITAVGKTAVLGMSQGDAVALARKKMAESHNGIVNTRFEPPLSSLSAFDLRILIHNDDIHGLPNMRKRMKLTGYLETTRTTTHFVVKPQAYGICFAYSLISVLFVCSGIFTIRHSFYLNSSDYLRLLKEKQEESRRVDLKQEIEHEKQILRRRKLQSQRLVEEQKRRSVELRERDLRIQERAQISRDFYQQLIQGYIEQRLREMRAIDQYEAPALKGEDIKHIPDVEASDGDTDTCTICQDRLCQMPCTSTTNMLKMLPCQHKFHSSCIAKWLERCGSCPNCRKKVEITGLRSGN
jgi:hypothetical protein